MTTAHADIEHHFAGGVYIKRAVLPKGYHIRKHTHGYEHFSVLAVGRATVHRGGEVLRLKSGDILKVPMNMTHEVQADEDCIWLCIHATGETDPERIDTVLTRGADHAV